MPPPRASGTSHPVIRSAFSPPRIALLVLAIATTPFPGTGQEPRTLPESGYRSAEIEPGETHGWTLDLARGQYVAVEVRQKGADVAVRVAAPDEEGGFEANAPSGSAGTERLVFVAQRAGPWTVVVTAAEVGAVGSYQIEVVARRAARPSDTAEIEADSLARLAMAEHVAGRWEAAGSLYDLALAVPGQGDRATSRSLYYRALLAYEMGLYGEAEPLLNRALEAMEAVHEPDDPELASPLTTLASFYTDLGRYAEAAPLFERALELLQGALPPDDVDVAGGLANLAAFYQYQARLGESEALYREALEIQQEALSPRHPTVATTLGNLGLLHASQGRHREAEAELERALGVLQEVWGPSDPELAPVLSDLAWLRADQGLFAEAEVAARRALRVLQEGLAPRHPDVARATLDLAALLHLQERRQEAEPLYRLAIEIWESTGQEHLDAAFAMDNLGLLLFESGRPDEAEAQHKLALERLEASDPEHPDVALTLSHLALMYTEEGRLDEAGPLHERALDIAQRALGPDHPDVALTLNNVAVHRFAEGRLEEADSLVTLAVDLLDRVPVYPEERINAYALRSRIRRASGNHDGAMDDLDEALYGAEELRPQVSGGEEARARFFGQYADHFDRMVSWLLEEGRVEDAFEVAERGRARVLLDQLAAGRIDLRSSIPDDIRRELERREEALGAQLAEAQQHLTLTWASQDLTGESRRMRIEELEDTLQRAAAAYGAIYNEIRSASPLWRDMVTAGGEPVDMRSVQRELIPRNGLLLAYQIGRGQSWLFVVPPGRGEPVAHRLDVTRDLARAIGIEAGALTSEGLMTVLGGGGDDGGAGLLGRIREPGSRRGTRVAGRARTVSLATLRELLLPDSVWATVSAAEEVIVVPDEGLHSLPFEALEIRSRGGSEEPVYWLDEGPVIRYAASVTALHNITRRPAARAVPVAGAPALLSVSDPVYDAALVGRGGSSADATDLVRGEFSTRGGVLMPLPGTARETEAIREALTAVGAAGAMDVLSGLDATEPRLTEALAGKRYVHLATHGLVDERRGSLFAALALTPPAGEATTLGDDGFLQLHEIYELELSETELAVLSACETNLGTSVVGEGVFALSRGFLVAGARRVVASQWQVSDESTADLIARFLEFVVQSESAGEPIDYARALRDAKREVRASESWSDPFNWAPFILTGQR